MRQSISCKSPLDVLVHSNISSYARRVYDDEDEGEDIRHGHEPSDIPPAGASEFAVGEEEEDDDAGEGEAGNGSDEARTWSRSERSSSPPGVGKYHDALDDRHVWDSKDRQGED